MKQDDGCLLVFTFNGVTDTTKGWSKRLGVKFQTFCSRIYGWKHYGKPYESIFAEGRHHPKERIVSHNGNRHTMRDWSQLLNIAESTFHHRIHLFKVGKITEEECFRYGKLPFSRKIIRFEGKTYTTEGIARKLDISVKTFLGRLCKFEHGKISRETLFSKGKITHAERNHSAWKTLNLTDGSRTSYSELARIAGVSLTAILRMRDKGKSPDEILEWAKSPSRQLHGSFWIGGERKRTKEVLDELNLSHGGISRRIKSGWSVEEALSLPRMNARDQHARAIAEKMRRKKLRELRKMGVMV